VCSFGAFPSGSSDLTVSLAFSVPADSGAVSFAASASYSGGSNNDSSGRTNVMSQTVTTPATTDPNVVTGFVVSALGDLLANVPVADGDSPGNPQSASANVPASAPPGFGVAGRVEDVPHPGDTTTDCGPGASCWGQSVDVTFLDALGQDATLSAPASVVIRTDTTEIPNGVNRSNIQWFHNNQLLPSCSGTATPTNGCVQSVQKLKDNDLLTTIRALHHGHYRP
jgi:hypothetical protein